MSENFFENRLIFGEVMGKSLVSFFGVTMYMWNVIRDKWF